MTQLLIEIDTPEDEALLIQLLPRLNSRLIERKAIIEEDKAKSSFGDILDRLARTDIAEQYGDPSEWQRETRKDRPLAGREE